MRIAMYTYYIFSVVSLHLSALRFSLLLLFGSALFVLIFHEDQEEEGEEDVSERGRKKVLV